MTEAMTAVLMRADETQDGLFLKLDGLLDAMRDENISDKRLDTLAKAVQGICYAIYANGVSCRNMARYISGKEMTETVSSE